MHFFKLLPIVLEQAIDAAKPQVAIAVLTDSETVVDIVIFSAYKFKVLAIEAKNAFLYTVEQGSCIPDPYITSPILHDLRNLAHAFRSTEVR